uniref:(northern house mosquito) hypothetical protein n=1 Tax=Culex pipiens TaxID=7175 RepID=A0A8D8EUB6_CULPI
MISVEKKPSVSRRWPNRVAGWTVARLLNPERSEALSDDVQRVLELVCFLVPQAVQGGQLQAHPEQVAHEMDGGTAVNLRRQAAPGRAGFRPTAAAATEPAGPVWQR